MITATLRNYRQSPRKARLVARLLAGKKVSEAIITLEFVNKKATKAFATLLNSAIANAKHNGKISDVSDLIVKEARVDAGYVLKRRMPRARGMAYPINKRTSHITLTLAPKAVKVVKGAKVKAKK